MAQENVEIWRTYLDDLLAANESNWEQWLARIPEILDPEIKWDASQTAVPDLAGVYLAQQNVEAVRARIERGTLGSSNASSS